MLGRVASRLSSTSAGRWTGACAALAWLLACVRWFDDGAAWRADWLQALPAWLPGGVALVALAIWLAVERPAMRGEDVDRRALGSLVALAVGLRLPLVWSAAAGYLTSDGALSGLVALRLREAREHFVFVPAVPYSGSLKSHLAAPLSVLLDPARAFALSSLFFFALAVAAVFRLAWRVGGPRAAWGAGLYLALAPAFVTQYSLSNDGNYVEVLALGPWALLLALRALHAARPGPLRVAAGLLLGLAFWCHILALIPTLAVSAVLAHGTLRRTGARAALRALATLAWALALGYFPALLWNASNGWESLRYLVPGLQPVGEGERHALGARLLGLLADHLPIMCGYSGGPTAALDTLAFAFACATLVALSATALQAARTCLGRGDDVAGETLCALLALAGVNLGVALLALPYLPSNPRYLVFLAVPFAVLLGWGAARWRHGRLGLALLLAFGAWGSWDQARLKRQADRDWRALARGLEDARVRHCYSDFYVATKLNFLTQERVVCSAKLGPTTTEYFFEYRRAVDQADAAAYVATNHAQGEKLARRLTRLGVAYNRLELPKPVLLPARHVDPAEIFPGRDFPLR